MRSRSVEVGLVDLEVDVQVDVDVEVGVVDEVEVEVVGAVQLPPI